MEKDRQSEGKTSQSLALSQIRHCTMQQVGLKAVKMKVSRWASVVFFIWFRRFKIWDKFLFSLFRIGFSFRAFLVPPEWAILGVLGHFEGMKNGTSKFVWGRSLLRLNFFNLKLTRFTDLQSFASLFLSFSHQKLAHHKSLALMVKN